MKISFWSVFRWTQRAITQHCAITISPILFKMVLNWAQGLNKKSHWVSARKNNKWLRYSKKCWGGQIPPPGSFRVNLYNCNWLRIDVFNTENPQNWLGKLRSNLMQIPSMYNTIWLEKRLFYGRYASTILSWMSSFIAGKNVINDGIPGKDLLPY